MLWLILMIVAFIAMMYSSENETEGLTIAWLLLAIVCMIVFVLRAVAIRFWI